MVWVQWSPRTNLLWLVMLDRLFENVNGAVDVFLVRIHRHQSWNLQSQQQFILTHTSKNILPSPGIKTHHSCFVLELFNGP